MYLEIRKATERDYAAICRIQQLCPEAAQWPVGDYSNYEVLVAYGNGEAAGFCAWRRLSADESELLNLAVDPDQRRNGVARGLLERLERDAPGCLFLEVAENNTAALSLYRKLGWEPSGRRRAYYHGGTTDAIVMKKGSW